MGIFESLNIFLDPYFIWVFRLPETPWIGFALGVAFLCLLTTVIGELSMAGIYFFNKEHFAEHNREMVRHNNMSLRSLLVKNKEGFKALNKRANDEFGKNFFSRIALFGASLWPAFFIMGWLDFRFAEVDFTVPWVGLVGPGFFFVPAYIVTRILFEKNKKRIPLFRSIARKVAENEETDEELMGFKEMEQEAQAMNARVTDSKKNEEAEVTG